MLYSQLPGWKERRPMKVFIADDSDVVRKRLRELLDELQNVELVGEARDAGEALTLLSNLHADVIILDIRMPGGNGMAVLEAQKSRLNPPIVIVYTSFPYPQYRKAYLDAGADYLIDKANDSSELLHLIADLSKPNRGISGVSRFFPFC